MNAEEKHLEQRVLRNLMRHGRQQEGKLAARCQRGVFMDSWKGCVQRLIDSALVAAVPTGYAHARELELTESGLAEARKTKAQRNEQAAREILATAEQAG